MKEHECKAPDYCTCNLMALAPDEHCPIHGHPLWPRHCMICGRFIPNKKTVRTIMNRGTVIIPSTISLSGGIPSGRSVWGWKDRLEQTKRTVENVLQTMPGFKIHLVDASDQDFTNEFSTYGTYAFKYIYLRDIRPDVHHVCNTHWNKSHMECSIMAAAIEYDMVEILSKDFLFKVGARGTMKNVDVSMLIPENRNKLFFKSAGTYPPEDTRDFKWMKQDDKLVQFYPGVVYGCGTDKIYILLGMLYSIISLTDINRDTGKDTLIDYDIECLSHWLMGPHRKDIVELKWLYQGYFGTLKEYFVI